jgi:hypothetical protein
MTSVPAAAMPPRLQRAIRTPEGETFLRGLAGTRVRQNGCAAAAYAALYANVDVITAYPIRPYTAIMMNLAKFVADGILDAEYLHADGGTPRSLRRVLARAPAAPGPTPARPGQRHLRLRDVLDHLRGAHPIQMAIADLTLTRPATSARSTRPCAPGTWAGADGLGRDPAGGLRRRCSAYAIARGPASACRRWWCRTTS